MDNQPVDDKKPSNKKGCVIRGCVVIIILWGVLGAVMGLLVDKMEEGHVVQVPDNLGYKEAIEIIDSIGNPTATWGRGNLKNRELVYGIAIDGAVAAGDHQEAQRMIDRAIDKRVDPSLSAGKQLFDSTYAARVRKYESDERMKNYRSDPDKLRRAEEEYKRTGSANKAGKHAYGGEGWD